MELVKSTSSEEKCHQEPSGQPLAAIENDDPPQAPTSRDLTGLKWAIVVVSVVSSVFLYAFDNTVMANVRPGIVKTFGHMDMLPWLSVSYPMGEVGANPLWHVLALTLEIVLNILTSN